MPSRRHIQDSNRTSWAQKLQFWPLHTQNPGVFISLQSRLEHLGYSFQKCVVCSSTERPSLVIIAALLHNSPKVGITHTPSTGGQMEAYSHTGDSRAVRTKDYYSWPHGWASWMQCWQKGGWHKRTHTVCFNLGFKTGKTLCGLRNQDSSYPGSGLMTGRGYKGAFWGGGHVLFLDWMLVTWSVHFVQIHPVNIGLFVLFLMYLLLNEEKKVFFKKHDQRNIL